jgi:hypothetical protein
MTHLVAQRSRDQLVSRGLDLEITAPFYSLGVGTRRYCRLTPAQCFEAAIKDDTNTIFMHLGGELDG